MSLQGVQATASTSVACIVEEPSDADGVSERSASVGEQTRYSMAEMEAYIRLVQEDRCKSISLVTSCLIESFRRASVAGLCNILACFWC